MVHDHSHSHSHTSSITSSAVKSFLFNEFSLTFWGVLVLMNVRLLSAITIHVDDCDETFNYWEPLHFLLFGSGLQTWEYSPTYALRSYPYLLPLYYLGSFLQYMGVGGNKMVVYFVLKSCLALFSSFCEMYLIEGVGRRFGRFSSFDIFSRVDHFMGLLFHLDDVF